jgi:hypothetical protein
MPQGWASLMPGQPLLPRAAKVFPQEQSSSSTRKKAAVCCPSRRLIYSPGWMRSPRPVSAPAFIAPASRPKKSAASPSSPRKISVKMQQAGRLRIGSRTMLARRRRDVLSPVVRLVQLKAALRLPTDGSLLNPRSDATSRPDVSPTTTAMEAVIHRESILPGACTWTWTRPRVPIRRMEEPSNASSSCLRRSLRHLDGPDLSGEARSGFVEILFRPDAISI